MIDEPMKVRLFGLLPGRVQRVVVSLLKRNDREFWSPTLRRLYKDFYGLDIGLGSYGCFNVAAFPPGTVIGRYSSIAEGVWTFNGNHPIGAPSMHPLFYNKTLGLDVKDIPRRNLRIGHGTWIGRNALITPSCSEIGNGAVVGAGSIVTHDVPPYAVVVGNPAKVIKYRFTPPVIEMIEKSKWWELSEKELREAADSFVDLEAFTARFN